MSTRATIKIKDRNDVMWVYHHSDGYPEGVGRTLKEYLAGIDYWSCDDIATDLVKGKKVYDDEFEMTTCQHGDENYAYLIDCDKETLTCYKVDWDEYDWKEDKIVVIE